MDRLHKKIALITGGAQGIGLAIANKFVSEGATVIISDRNQKVGQALSKASESITFFQHDVSEDDQWQSLLGYISKEYQRLDILINNAGILATEKSQTLETTDLKQWHDIQMINSDGVFLGCKYGVKLMKNTGGSIVNISSIAGLRATPHLVAYGASKSTVRQLTKSVAAHCGQKGYRIRCNSIHPGVIETDMGNHLISLGGGNFDDAWQARVSEIPLGEAGKPEDVANCALFLASDEARYVTGAELVVDGGNII